jgi:hypothetical protein
LQDPPKFTQIGIFGLKTNHLATLIFATFFGAVERKNNPRLKSILSDLGDQCYDFLKISSEK